MSIKHIFEYILIALIVGGPHAPIDLGAASVVHAESGLPQAAVVSQTRAPERAPRTLPVIEDRYAWPKLTDENTRGMVVTAASALLVDRDNGKVLFAKNADDPRSLASITKLVSVLVLLDTGVDFGRRVTITDADQGTGEGTVFKVGDVVSAHDLFFASLIASANDGVRALVRSTGLTSDAFADRMNTKARALGMTNAHFVEPTGLDSANRGTARDVVMLLRAAHEKSLIRDVTRMAGGTITVNGVLKNIKSTDLLLLSFLNENPYSIAVGKTGSLDAAGYCLGLLVEHEGNGVYAVVLGSTDHFSRFSDAKALVYWAFNKWQWKPF